MSDSDESQGARLLAIVDRFSYWGVKLIAVAILVFGVVLIGHMSSSGHGAGGLLFLPVLPLAAWLLWRLKPLILRVAVVAFAVAEGVTWIIQCGGS